MITKIFKCSDCGATPCVLTVFWGDESDVRPVRCPYRIGKNEVAWKEMIEDEINEGNERADLCDGFAKVLSRMIGKNISHETADKIIESWENFFKIYFNTK